MRGRYEYFECFPPILDANTRVLILGSIPGLASLKQGEYYAHPQNHFWRLIGEILGQGDLREQPGPIRTAVALKGRLGIWAAIGSCQRIASSDASIREARPVDLPAALKIAHNNHLQAVFFDGRRAEAIFMRLAYPYLPEVLQKLPFRYLPSSSPAFAQQTVDQKLKEWSIIADYL